jgi:hypothetical protein
MSTKVIKALVAALVLTGASTSLVTNASAAPTYGYSSQAEQNWMDRASNGGHHEGDTNGF